MNMEFLEWCDLHRILLAVYPPHSTHRLQPLDVSLFNPLANYYSQELNKWTFTTQGLSKLSKRDFFSLFWPAFLKAISPENVASGWMKTGLSPFNPEVVLSQIKSIQSSRPNSSGSASSTALSNIDWIKVNRLLKSAVGGVLGPEVRKISNTLEQYAAEVSILRAENQGLRRAVFMEKKRRQRGKPLFEILRDDASKALFFSPSKIQQVRELVVLKEDEKLKLTEQKVKEKEERQLQKEAKAAEVVHRKSIMQVAQIQKAKEKEAKRTAKEEARLGKQASQQIQNGLKEQAKGCRKKVPPISVQEEVLVGGDTTTKEVVVEMEKGRLGRPRRLPTRFQQ